MYDLYLIEYFILTPSARKAWLDYCLIHPSSCLGIFMADNHFDKRIILLNKEKVQLLANAKLDTFLKEVVALNILLLWKCRKIILHIIGATLYSNRHSLIARLPNVSLFIKYIAGNLIFQEKLDWYGA